MNENFKPQNNTEALLLEIAKNGGGGSSVQSDLSQNDPTAPDYVKNRTHYEETTTVNEPLNITWDGNTEGLVSVGGMMYKVSDLVLTDEQIKSASIFFAGTEMPMTDDDWAAMVASGNVTEEIVNLNFLVMFVRKAGAVVQGVALPETGIYFANNQTGYVSSLTTTEPVPQTKTVVHKLDKKFLPDDVGGGAFVVEVDWDNYKAITPLNDIRDAWRSNTPIVLYQHPSSIEGYAYTFAEGSVRGDNDNFFSASFTRMGVGRFYICTIGEDGSVYVEPYIIEMAKDR